MEALGVSIRDGDGSMNYRDCSVDCSRRYDPLTGLARENPRGRSSLGLGSYEVHSWKVGAKA